MTIDEFLDKYGTVIKDNDLILLTEATIRFFGDDDDTVRNPILSTYRLSFEELKRRLNDIRIEDTSETFYRCRELWKRQNILPAQLVKTQWAIVVSYASIGKDSMCDFECGECTKQICGSSQTENTWLYEYCDVDIATVNRLI